MKRKTILLNGALCVAVLGVGFGGWSVLHSDSTTKASTRTTATVAKGVVQQSVTATGNLAAITQLDVSFDSAVASNLVTDVMVKVGDKVTLGQPLAKVDDRLVQANLASATASMTVAQSNYDKAKAGLSADDRATLDAQEAQSLASVGAAQTALDNSRATADQNVITQAESVRQAQLALTNAQAQADRDAVTAQTAVDQARGAYDPLVAARDSAKSKRDSDQAALAASTAQLATYTADNQYCTGNVGAVNAPDGVACAGLPALIATATADQTAKQTTLNTSQAALDHAESVLTPAANALTNASNSLESTKLKSKQTLDNANNAVINAQNNQASGALKDQQSIASAQRQYDSALASYQSLLATDATKRKPPTDADIASQQVALINAQNSLATAQKNAAAATIVAPSAGTVAIINGKVGSAGSATGSTGTGANASSTPFLTLTDPSAFEVKAGFSEADAAKVKAAQTATVTVDAVNARLTGTVRSIDTTSTVVSNVVTYYAYISIAQVPSTVTVQAGMTASVSVAVQRLTDVLMLPTASVSSRGTTATVQVETKANPKKTEPRDITIGLRGDTTLEIVSGLAEGDVVVTTRTAVSTAASASANATSGVLTGAGTPTGVVGAGGVGAGGFTGGGAGGRTPAAGGARAGG